MLNEMVLGEPRYLPTVVADKTTAMAVVQAVTAALFCRERTGIGQEIEVPMFETMVYFVMAEHLWGMTFEPPIGTAGYTRLMSHHRKPYKTKDGYIAILPYLDSHWETFCKLSGQPDLIEDRRFKTLNDRVTNIDDTYSETAKIMATRTTGEWLKIFGETSVPTIVVNTLEDLTHDPHLKAVGFWQEVDHPTEGRLRMTRFPMTFSETPADVRRLQPRLGEHSVEVLREAGYSQADIDGMLASGAVAQAPKATSSLLIVGGGSSPDSSRTDLILESTQAQPWLLVRHGFTASRPVSRFAARSSSSQPGQTCS